VKGAAKDVKSNVEGAWEDAKDNVKGAAHDADKNTSRAGDDLKARADNAGDDAEGVLKKAQKNVSGQGWGWGLWGRWGLMCGFRAVAVVRPGGVVYQVQACAM
jgi:hypothetical protein